MLKTYLITYDNTAPRRYQALYDLLIRLGAIPLAQSVWLTNFTGDAVALRQLVSSTIESIDLVVVLELARNTDWATINASIAANDFLSRNISPSRLAA